MHVCKTYSQDFYIKATRAVMGLERRIVPSHTVLK